VRELVIVISDLYVPASVGAGSGGQPSLPGLEFLARFGTRQHLADGWRGRIATWCGSPEAAGAPRARIAAATAGVPAATVLWIATPVHLSAGLARVHLDHRGLLQLKPSETSLLAQEFLAAFAGSGLSLVPLSSGDLLLGSPDVEAVEVTEPARSAGATVEEVLPRGPRAAGLRRSWTEMEMWLHGLALNRDRAARGALPVTALWPWGATGSPAAAIAARGPDPSLKAFGRDPWLRGLWHLRGGHCQEVPDSVESVLGGSERAVMAIEAGTQMQDGRSGLGEALAHLDARYLQPAVAAVRGGGLTRLTLLANDTALSVERGAQLKLWRTRRAGIEGLT
jgi:hypothetical protein